MLDIDTYIEYNIAEKIALMRLTDFAYENNYIFHDSVSLYDNSVTFVFIDLFSIDDLKIVVKINEDLYFRLLSEKNLADYVINEVEKEKEED